MRFSEQRELLLKSCYFKENDCVDMGICWWEC